VQLIVCVRRNPRDRDSAEELNTNPHQCKYVREPRDYLRIFFQKHLIYELFDIHMNPHGFISKQRRRMTGPRSTGFATLHYLGGICWRFAILRKGQRMELTRGEIEVLLENLKYSIQRVSEARGTLHEVRQENLQCLTDVQAKLRLMRDNSWT